MRSVYTRGRQILFPCNLVKFAQKVKFWLFFVECAKKIPGPDKDSGDDLDFLRVISAGLGILMNKTPKAGVQILDTYFHHQSTFLLNLFVIYYYILIAIHLTIWK